MRNEKHPIHFGTHCYTNIPCPFCNSLNTRVLWAGANDDSSLGGGFQPDSFGVAVFCKECQWVRRYNFFTPDTHPDEEPEHACTFCDWGEGDGSRMVYMDFDNPEVTADRLEKAWAYGKRHLVNK